jgi:hypothetical protein
MVSWEQIHGQPRGKRWPAKGRKMASQEKVPQAAGDIGSFYLFPQPFIARQIDNLSIPLSSSVFYRSRANISSYRLKTERCKSNMVNTVYASVNLSNNHSCNPTTAMPPWCR